MSPIPMTPNALWYADGVRWVASLLHVAADHLDLPALEPHEPRHLSPVEERYHDMRHRVQTHF
jgi:hypothetical protein